MIDEARLAQNDQLAQASIRLEDIIMILKDLDKWSIIIGDNHLDIKNAIEHLQHLQSSVATRRQLIWEAMFLSDE